MPISDAQQTKSQRLPPLLEFNDVNTYYGELHVLKGVNYRVGEGEIVCLLGGNASGKSTTMKTIFGIVKPTERHRDLWRQHHQQSADRRTRQARHRAGARRRGACSRA